MQLNSGSIFGYRGSGSYNKLDVGSLFYLGGLPRLSDLNPRSVKDVNSQKDFEGSVSELKVRTRQRCD